MARVAVIGEPLRIYGYGLAGAALCPAATQDEAVAAWRALPDDVAVAVLTPAAARWLATEIARRPGVLPVILPEPGAAAFAAGAPVLPESIAPESIAPESIAPESIAPESFGPEPVEPGPALPDPGTRPPSGPAGPPGQGTGPAQHGGGEVLPG